MAGAGWLSFKQIYQTVSIQPAQKINPGLGFYLAPRHTRPRGNLRQWGADYTKTLMNAHEHMGQNFNRTDPLGVYRLKFCPCICGSHRCLCVHNVSRFFKAALFAANTSHGCQQKHTFINNYLNKASKKMIHNAATKNCRSGRKNHDTQFPADVHSFKLPCFLFAPIMVYKQCVFYHQERFK